MILGSESDFAELETAVADLEKAVSISPHDPKLWCALGEAQAIDFQGLYFEEHFEKAIAVDPNFVPAIIGMGKAAAQGKRYEAAIEYFARAIAVDPEVIEAYSWRAVALMRLSQFEPAICDLNVELAHFPNREQSRLRRLRAIRFASMSPRQIRWHRWWDIFWMRNE